jgi:hypothetical protein
MPLYFCDPATNIWRPKQTHAVPGIQSIQSIQSDSGAQSAGIVDSPGELLSAQDLDNSPRLHCVPFSNGTMYNAVTDLVTRLTPMDRVRQTLDHDIWLSATDMMGVPGVTVADPMSDAGHLVKKMRLQSGH